MERVLGIFIFGVAACASPPAEPSFHPLTAEDEELNRDRADEASPLAVEPLPVDPEREAELRSDEPVDVVGMPDHDTQMAALEAAYVRSIGAVRTESGVEQRIAPLVIRVVDVRGVPTGQAIRADVLAGGGRFVGTTVDLFAAYGIECQTGAAVLQPGAASLVHVALAHLEHPTPVGVPIVHTIGNGGVTPILPASEDGHRFTAHMPWGEVGFDSLERAAQEVGE